MFLKLLVVQIITKYAHQLIKIKTHTFDERLQL